MKLVLPAPAGRPDLLIVAGEHSGDAHAARMVRGLRQADPAARVCALGGPELAAAGAQVLWDLTAASVVGVVEVLRNLAFFAALAEATVQWIREYKPRAVCFVDYPGFNLRLAERLRRLGLSRKGGGAIATLYYISPQIWAWKGARRFSMARDLDAMAVIFPFELGAYADTPLPVAFVGHPFGAEGGNAEPSPVHYDAGGPVLLLPGSRRQAVRRIFPLLLAGHRACGSRPAVALYPSEAVREVLEASLGRGSHPGVSLQPVRGARIGAAAVLTSSGTMSLQCALAGIPGAIVYRANPGTYWLGRMILQIKHLGIANLLLKETMYPEYIQGQATPGALAAEIQDCLAGPNRRERALAQSRRLRELLAVPATDTPSAWLLRQLKS